MIPQGLNFVRRSLLSVALFGAVGVAACAHDVPLQTSGRIPAAEGELKVSKAPNDNTKVKLEVDHLAIPEKMAPGASTYVVWIQSAQGGAVQNAGALQLDDKHKGKLETITPHKEFQVFITAEPIPTVSTPTSERLMFATVRR